MYERDIGFDLRECEYASQVLGNYEGVWPQTARCVDFQWRACTQRQHIVETDSKLVSSQSIDPDTNFPTSAS